MPRIFSLLLSGALALAASSDAADTAAPPPVRTERVTREIEGVRFEFPKDQPALIEALAPRVAELNRDATATSPAAWSMPRDDGPLSARDFRENRDAWLAAAAGALGLDSPTPLQIECFDQCLRRIADIEAETEASIVNARSNRVIRVVTLWSKAELRRRLLTGETVPGFTTTQEKDEVQFNWNFHGSPAWPAEELARRQAQEDALHLRYVLAAEPGRSGIVVRGRATPHRPGTPGERLAAQAPAAGPAPFPFVTKPEDAGLAPRDLVEKLFDKTVRGMRDSFASMTAPGLDRRSVAGLVLVNLIDAGLRERVIASADRRWFTEGVSRYLAWRIARDRAGADAARRVFGIDEALLESADLRSAVDLRGWSDPDGAPDSAQNSGRLPEAQGAFAAHAVKLMVDRNGEDFLARLLAETRKTPVAKADMRTVAKAYGKLTGTQLDALLRDAVSVDAVVPLEPSWNAPGVGPAPAAAPAPAGIAPRAFPHEHSDLAPDARITWGRLENGLRYAIFPHPVPTRRASAFLLVEAGTYNEHENERGYAHYVEHMAFKGLRDLPRQTLISRLGDLGVSFGPHANATTTQLATTYHFDDIPADEPGALRTVAGILRNIADGMLFDPKDVELECPVILQEGRARASWLSENWSEELGHLPPQSRPLMSDELTGIFGGTRLEWWMMGPPIRNIKGANPKTLRAFYDRWYRPERMVVVVAGDVSAAEIEPTLRETFAGFAGRGPAEIPPAIPDPRLDPRGDPAVSVDEWPQETRERVTFADSIPRSGGDSIERRRQLVTLDAALEMIEARAAATADIPASLDAWTAHDVPGWDIPLLRLSGRAGDLREAALAIDREFRRAWTDGFDEHELAGYISKKRELAATRAIEAEGYSAAVCAQGIAVAIANGVVFMSPDDERALRERLLADLTPERCRDALRAAWPWHRLRIIVSGPAKKKSVEKAGLAKAVLDARSAALAPADAPAEVAAFPFTDFGAPGAVSSRRHDESLDAWFVTFANGVRLNIKHTGAERDWVRVNLNFGHGILGAPKEKPGLVYAFLTLMRDGLEGHPEYAGGVRPAGYGFDNRYGYDADHFSLSGDVRAEAVPRLLQYFAATLTHPGNRGRIEGEVRTYIESEVAQRQRVAHAVSEETILERISNGHPAMHRVTLAEGLAPSCEEMRAWLAPQLARSPLEVAVVGDCDVDAVIAAAASTLGALPARDTADVLAGARASTVRTGFRERVEFDGFTSVAATTLAWPMAVRRGPEDKAALAVLSRVLETRVWRRLREEMGETYSPRIVWLHDDITTPHRLVLRCTVETKPRAANRCAKALRQITATLASGGIAEDEFQRALRPLQREAEIDMRTNTWWLDRLAEAHGKPEQLASDAALASAYARVTRMDVEALAKTLLCEENSAEIVAMPR